MRIVILSRSSRLYSTRRLCEAAKEHGHDAFVRDVMKYTLVLESAKPGLQYSRKAIRVPDVIIPRIGTSVTFHGTAVVRQFEQMGVYTPNSALAISTSRDKLRSLQVLSRHDIAIPTSAYVRRRNDAHSAIERVGGAPVIIKLLQGTQGIGVILADTAKVAEAIIETLQSTNHDVLIQAFVEESRGRDIRAFVVGDEVVGAMRRTAQGTEFRSNVHRGGKAESITPSPEMVRTAVRAAHVHGLHIAGVDMLEGRHGPVVMEVNSSPGLEGIEGATDADIAGAIIDLVERSRPKTPVNYRAGGDVLGPFGVVELEVTAASELAGVRLGDSGLDDIDVTVLAIDRRGSPTLSPGPDTRLKAGDRLVCFGDRNSILSYLSPDDRGSP